VYNIGYLDTDIGKSLEADKMIAEQLPHRKNIFDDTDKQQTELGEFNEKTNTMILQFEKQLNVAKQKYSTIPDKATIKKEYINVEKNFV
jgi:hypothetical protein